MFKVLEPPEIFPVALDEVKMHLRVEHSEEDVYLKHLVETATEYMQEYLNRSLIQQKVCFMADGVLRPDGLVELELPRPNVLKVESVKSIRASVGLYPIKRFQVINKNFITKIIVYTRDITLEVVYQSGFGVYPSHIPSPIRHGILQLITELYECRGGISEGKFFKNNSLLLQKYRVVRGK